MNITTPVEKKRLNSNYCATLGKEKGENGNNKYSLPPKAISEQKPLKIITSYVVV